MKRRKADRLKSLYKSFQLPLTIIAALLLIFTGNIGSLVGEIVSHAENYRELMDNSEENIIKESVEEEEVFTEEEATEEEVIEEEVIEREVVIEDEQEEKKEDLAKNQIVITLENLVNRDGDDVTWSYIPGSLGGTLRLLSDTNYVLQNVEGGADPTRTVPIHIIVDDNVSNINITLNNIRISRTSHFNDDVLPVDSAANGVIFVSNANATITLNGTNTIDGTDTFPTPNNRFYLSRSAIYLYAGTTEVTNTLTINGSGKLTIESSGINSFATTGSTSKIIIDASEVNVNISGTRLGQVAIGGTASTSSSISSSDIQHGNLFVEIKGGTVNVTMQLDVGTGRNAVTAAVIGTGPVYRLSDQEDDLVNFDSLSIVINKTADVNVEFVLEETSGVPVSIAVGIAGAIIGTGAHSGNINAINIEISDQAKVIINRILLKQDSATNVGAAGIFGAAIGTGGMSSQHNNVTVNDTIIKISGTSYVEINTVADSNKDGSGTHNIVLSGPNIGIGSTDLINNSDANSYNYNNVVITIEDNPTINIDMFGRRTGSSTVNANVPVIGVGSGVKSLDEHVYINIHGGTIKSHLKIEDESGVGGMNVNFTGIGPGVDNDFDEFNINITGGDISIKNEINSPNNRNVILGAGIGESSSSSSSTDSEMNIVISGNARVHVEGGEVGIGATAGSRDKVNVDIKKDEYGNVPNVFATAREGLAIVENDGSGITTDVMISQLNLGDDRSGDEEWIDWSDNAPKMIEVLRNNNGRVIREAEEIPPRIKSVAYSIPNINESTDTNVRVSFDGLATDRYFIDKFELDNIIFADDTLDAQDVIFIVYDSPLDLPPLRVLHEGILHEPGNPLLEGRNWSYVRSPNGGTLRLTDQGDFDIRNIESRHVDEEGSVPMNIIVESEASGSTLSFTNINVSRSDIAQRPAGVLNRDDEAIAPFVIKAANTEIVLTEGSTNIIDGADASLTGEGYRTAIYLYNSEANTVNLTVKASGTNEIPSLITLNGGINALGAPGATVNMNLDDAIYNLSAVGSNIRNGVAFGSSFVDGTVNYDLRLNLRNASYVRAIGDTVAIGHNPNIGASELSITGSQPKIEAITFTHGDVLSSKRLSSTSLGFRTTLNSGDNWESVIMRPYGGEHVGSTFWEVVLPTTSIYPNTVGQDISVVYSNPEAFNEASPFERMTMRIVRHNAEVNFLANVDGTGSTTPLISTNATIENLNTMLPDDGAINISIPNILLDTDMNQRTFSMMDDEVRNVTNNSSLPLSMSYRYFLGEMPDGVNEGSFATDSSDFEEVDGNEVEKILLEMVIDEVTGSSNVNIADRTPPLFPMPEDTFIDIAVLRGARSGVTPAVDLSVTGRFTEAMGRNITGDFISTIHLRWSREEFVQFS